MGFHYSHFRTVHGRLRHHDAGEGMCCAGHEPIHRLTAMLHRTIIYVVCTYSQARAVVGEPGEVRER
jgi:hypothetical protein